MIYSTIAERCNVGKGYILSANVGRCVGVYCINPNDQCMGKIYFVLQRKGEKCFAPTMKRKINFLCN